MANAVGSRPTDRRFKSGCSHFTQRKKLNRSVAQIKKVLSAGGYIMARACRCCKGRGSNPLTPTF